MGIIFNGYAYADGPPGGKGMACDEHTDGNNAVFLSVSISLKQI